jgi:NAD+ kinase
MSIQKVGIIANSSKESAVDYTCRLGEWLIERGLDVVLDEEIAEKAMAYNGVAREELADLVDIIVVFGGDGTLLVASRSVRGRDVPIVGVNLGGFGFMTVVNLSELFSAMELILAGDYTTSKRMMLDVILEHGQGQVEKHSVLNDVVINRGHLSRMINLETFVDDQYLSTFKADGLIISTPTGSTAYSLSAGGPIVLPDLNSIIINPICPHTLTNRPIMLPPDAVVKVVLWAAEENAAATFDGQVSAIMKSGDAIEVKMSNDYINLINSPYHNYLEILRTKLGWGGLP